MLGQLGLSLNLFNRFYAFNVLKFLLMIRHRTLIILMTLLLIDSCLLLFILVFFSMVSPCVVVLLAATHICLIVGTSPALVVGRLIIVVFIFIFVVSPATSLGLTVRVRLFGVRLRSVYDYSPALIYSLILMLILFVLIASQRMASMRCALTLMRHCGLILLRVSSCIIRSISRGAFF